MVVRFDDVVPALLRLAETNPLLIAATQIAVVRDPRGCVRLAIEAPSADDAARTALEDALSAKLGKWYSGPALHHRDGSVSEKRLASEILRQSKGKWPAGWPREIENPITGTKTAIASHKWGSLQRVLAKETWLDPQHVESPWALHGNTPTIVSFYSYKGGVGRSTLVAVVAATLARAGDNVVIVDLDLEAPGQQSIFRVEPNRGVIDYIVEHVAIGAADLTDLLIDVTTEVPDAKGSIRLVAAGAQGWTLVEKIARLDYLGHTGDSTSPVLHALKALLRAIMKDYAPGWILLDSRTGIHDLGGLAMHALAHIDVLLARNGRQGREGLELCLQALGRRRKIEDVMTLIVHSLVPAPLADETISKPVQEQFRHEVYETFRRTLYTQLEDPALPAEDDHSAHHTPYPIPLDADLGRLESFTEIAALTLDKPHYAAIVERLRELAEDDA